jgi:hypothetical protein
MSGRASGLVAIVREFFAVDVAMRRLVDRFRSGSLEWAEVDVLCIDEETSPLFRLKERCHALFRPRDVHAPHARTREVLFDLAVGSLFHEAMKFRENYYQHEIYGPQVRALRAGAGVDAEALFDEFEKILTTVALGVNAGLEETEALLNRTREQLGELLRESQDNGNLARCLIELAPQVEQVFGTEIDAFLVNIYGDASQGYAVAGCSYLESGYYEEAERSLAEALRRGSKDGKLERLRAYAVGMRSYLAGSYAEAVDQISTWADGKPPHDPALLALARDAISRIDDLAQGDDREQVVQAASALLERVGVSQSA